MMSLFFFGKGGDFKAWPEISTSGRVNLIFSAYIDALISSSFFILHIEHYFERERVHKIKNAAKVSLAVISNFLWIPVLYVRMIIQAMLIQYSIGLCPQYSHPGSLYKHQPFIFPFMGFIWFYYIVVKLLFLLTFDHGSISRHTGSHTLQCNPSSTWQEL